MEECLYLDIKSVSNGLMELSFRFFPRQNRPYKITVLMCHIKALDME